MAYLIKTKFAVPVGPAGQTLNDVEGIFTVEMRECFLNTAKGAEIYQQILDPRQEVVALVNHRGSVTVGWHRSKGPVFLAHYVNNARDPAHLIPFEVEKHQPRSDDPAHS